MRKAERSSSEAVSALRVELEAAKRRHKEAETAQAALQRAFKKKEIELEQVCCAGDEDGTVMGVQY